MKRILLLSISAVILLSCVTQPQDRPIPEQEITELMERWAEAVRTENPDLYLSSFWDNAALEIVEPDGRSQMFERQDVILDFQFSIWEQYDLSGFRIPDERELVIADDGEPVYIIYFGENRVEEFRFEEREGQWRIIFQLIRMVEMNPQMLAENEGVPVRSPLHEFYDRNTNGRLEPDEFEPYLEDFRMALSEPHDVSSPIDEFLDADRNGVIGPVEVHIIRSFFFVDQLRNAYRFAPDFGRFLDINENEYIELWEIETIPMMFFEDPYWRTPRPVDHPLDRRIDQDKNGELDRSEIQRFMQKILARIASLPIEQDIQWFREGTFGDLADWTDVDKNGEHDEREVADLGFLLGIIIQGGARPATNPVYGYFDRNKDWMLDHAEINRARELFFRVAMESMNVADSDDAIARGLDFDGNGSIDGEELEMLFDFLTKEMTDEPVRVTTPVEELLDRDDDGELTMEERVRIENTVFPRIAFTWLDTPEFHDRWDVRTILDELADLDGNGIIDVGENAVLSFSLLEPHPADSELDERLDLNGNGVVDDFEIIRARRAGLPGGSIGEDEMAEGPFPVVTLIDEQLDLNDDGEVDGMEMEAILDFFQRGARVDAGTPRRLLRLVDFDENGSVDREELILGRERYLVPHPVDADSELDRRLDTNEDGFVAPEEIGIAAGVTEAGPVAPFAERIDVGGWRPDDETTETAEEDSTTETQAEQDEQTASSKRFESEYYRKLGQIQDRKLAVVGLNSATQNVDEETSNGLIIFVENAFVNVGKVRVVDRKNIEKLIEEQKFQVSGLTDETTAVEIGKLSGADIVVIGSISYVGKMYYINIKLIAVETGEIIGSSIAQAADQTEFLDMTNEAVYKLF